MAVGTPTTFSKLVWNTAYSYSLFGNCRQLVFDATGDLVNSSNLVIYGSQNCGNLGFSMTGSLYMAVDGSLNISMMFAGHLVSCPRVVGWFGTCTILDANNVVRGTGQLQLLQ